MRLFRCARWVLPALMVLLAPVASFAGVLISVTVAPPELPVYEQPLCPQQGWMWSPGYWAYGDDGYYWVPGQWVPAPYVGALWTPPWWGWDSGHYRFHDGYWGDRVGYYGGVNYGYGYMGIGFVGGEWRGSTFAYNTAVMRVNTNVIRNTYVNQTIVRSNTIANERRVAYNGGPNGIHHDPTPVERTAMSGPHTPPTSVQQHYAQAARADRTSYAKANGGHPHTLAVAKPAEAARNTGATAHSSRETAKPEATRSATTAHTAPVEKTTRSTETHSTAHSTTARTAPETHTATSARTESRTAPSKTETRTTTAKSAPRTAAESKPSPSRTESRTTTPKTEPRTEARTTPAEKPKTASHATTPAPRTESHPAPVARSESHLASHPAPETHAESRPAPAPRAETRPAPAPHTESRPAPESHPAPQHESRPAPQHEAAPAAHPAPQHESKPAPAPHQEKPKPETR